MLQACIIYTSVEAELCGQQGEDVGLVVALHPAAAGDPGGAGLGDPGGAAVTRERVTSQLQPRDGGEAGSEEVSNIVIMWGLTIPDVLQYCQVIVAQVEGSQDRDLLNGAPVDVNEARIMAECQRSQHFQT